MTTGKLPREQSAAKQAKKVTFKCKYCGKTRPLEEMRTVTRFFPPVVVCRECDQKLL